MPLFRQVDHFYNIKNSYCVSTIGLDEDKIRRYVKWQEEKDKEDEASQSDQGSLF